MKSRASISTRLRRFIIVSVVLHIIVGCATVVPYLVKRHLAEQRRLSEQQAREVARKKAEEETKEAARNLAREKLEETLKQDAYEFLIDSVDELQFEEIWEDILAGLDVDIEALLQELEMAGYEIDPGRLQDMMADLRTAELGHLVDQIDSIAKEQIANWLLNNFQQSIPEFNARVEQVLESLAGKTEAMLERVFADQKRRRESAAERAIASLEKAQAQLTQADAANQVLMTALTDAESKLATPPAGNKKDGNDSDGPDGVAMEQSGPDGQGGSGATKPGPSHGPDGPGGGPDTPGATKSGGVRDTQKAALADARAKTLKSMLQLGGALQTSQHNIVLASRNADHTGDKSIADGLRDSAQSVEDVATSSYARTKELMTKKPEAIKQTPGFSAAPRALGYGDPEHLLRAASQESGKTASALDEISRDLSAQKQALRDLGSNFKAKTDRAVANLSAEDSSARMDAESFLESTLKHEVAEDYRKRAEKIARDVMKSRNMDADPGFVQALGQKVVDTLLGESTKEMREDAYDTLLADAKETFGVMKAQTRRMSAEEPLHSEPGLEDGEPTAGTPRAQGPEMPGGPAESGPDSPFDGPDGPGDGSPEAPGLPIAKGPSGEGPDGEGHAASAAESLDSGDGAQGPDDAGGPVVDSALMEKVNQAMVGAAERGLNRALRQAKSTLRLPGPASFGPGPVGLSLRLKQAMDLGARPSPGSGSRTLIDLDNDLDMIGSMQRSGFNRMRLLAGREVNHAEYRKNIESVIEGRDIEEALLSADSLRDDSSSAEKKMGDTRHGIILVAEETEPEKGAAEEDEEDRSLSEPNFTAFAYGGAPMTFEEPMIDGDLSDWEDLDDFVLRGRVKETGGFSEARFPEKWDRNRNLHVQWNLKGIYFAWRMVDDRDNIAAGKNSFWSNDGLELWFDFANKRSDRVSRETQQFWFWPLGSAHGPEILGGEAKPREGYNDARFRNGGSKDGTRMAVRRTVSPRGYEVELFLPAEVFAEPDLRPGRVIAFNYSINNGEDCYLRWTANLGKRESVTPSLWGDLLLLGTDSVVTLVKPGTEDLLEVIVPGEPLGVRVTDRDMNTDRTVREKIKVTLVAQNGDQVPGYLQETGVDTGIFDGSVDTELFLLQQEERFGDSVLQVSGGERIEVRYHDEARRYGERNFQAGAEIPVGLPVLDLASSHP